jgi:CRP-like cAMP-binding protein
VAEALWRRDVHPVVHPDVHRDGPSRGLVGGRPALVRHPPGTVVLEQGRADRNLYRIRTGLVKLGFVSAEGRPVTIEVLGPGDVFGEGALAGATRGPVPHPGAGGAAAANGNAVDDGSGPRTGLPRVVAVTWCELAVYPVGEVVAARDGDPLATLLVGLAARLRQAGSASADLALHGVDARVARVLLALAGPGGVDLGVPLAQHELAAMVGVARETVNRALARLRRRRCVALRDRRILLTDRAELERIWSRL